MNKLDYRIELSFQMLRNRKGAVVGAILAMTIGIMAIHVFYVISYGVYESVIRDVQEFHFGQVKIQDDEDYMEKSDRYLIGWLERLPNVDGAAPRLSSMGSVNATSQGERSEKTRVEILGVDPKKDPNASTIHKTIIDGKFIQTRSSAVVGSILAWELGGVKVGDSIQVKIENRWGQDSIKRFTVTGIAKSPGFSGVQNLLVLHIDTVREMLERPKGYNSVIVKLNDLEHSQDIKTVFLNSFPPDDYEVKTIQEHENIRYSGWQENLENYRIVGIFGMISSAFAIVTIQMMFVASKTRQIGILRAIGGQRHDILVVFVIQGLIIGSLGAAVGTGSGILFTAYVKEFGLTGSTYETRGLVVIYDWDMTIRTALIALMFALVASFYPAYRATKLQPLEAMRSV